MSRALKPAALLAAVGALAAGVALAGPLSGQTRPAARNVRGGEARWLGPAPAGGRITFALLLRLPGAGRLAAVLAAIENPRSPSFHHFIDPRSFGSRFGISTGRLAELERRVRADGLTVVTSPPQRTQLTVSATVGAVQHLFGVRIGVYRDRAGHRFELPRGAVRLPPALAGAVDAVTGLDTRPRWIAHDVPLGGLTPAEAAVAYDVTALHRAGIDGQGQTIAVISFSAYDPSDPVAYALRNHLTGPQPQVIPVDGGATDSSGAIEANLDIDVIRSIAPAARILVYEAPQTSASYADTINRIVAERRTDVISSSWGQCELTLDRAERPGEARALSAAVAAGVSMFVATGDSGAYDCQQSDLTDHRLSVDWPASSANAIAVGGTRLYLGGDYAYQGETAWEDQLSNAGGGGGLSTGDRRPVWQAAPGVLSLASNGQRQLPDVSADADPGTPWSFYAYGSSGSVGGTSAAAPFWAAATLLIRQYANRHGIRRLGYVNPILYALASSRQRRAPFHDVTRGGNRFYQATPGWDPATGLGSPDVYNLARDMVAYLRRHRAR